MRQQSRQFRTFDEVLSGLRELRTAGWQVRMQPAYADRRRQRVAMLAPGRIDWRLSHDPLEALLVHFVPDAVFEETINEQAAALGLPYPAGQWIYALAADDREHLEKVETRRIPDVAFVSQQQKLLDACGVNPRLLTA